MIAVEGDRAPASGPRPTPGELDAELTQVKPVTVVSSGPRAMLRDAESIEGDAPGVLAPPVRRAALVWTAVAVVSMAVVVSVLLVTGGGDPPDGELSPTASAPSTPQSVAPEAPTGVPELSGRRTRTGVEFTWSSTDEVQRGDSWEWRRPETGETTRTSDTRLRVRSAGGSEVCLQVRLIRGSFASAWADACVS